MRCLHRAQLTSVVILTLFTFPVLLFAQIEHQPGLGPPLRPLVRLTGYLNATIPKGNVLPVLTLKLPDSPKRYTFLLRELKVMAGPLRTSESILSEVTPYTTNFYLHASQDNTKQIASATPTEQLTILAEYLSPDRVLRVQNVEKGEASSQ